MSDRLEQLPDSVLVATLLNKTAGAALQQHLRLNARSLNTYAQIKDVIVEYFRSRHILTSNNNGPAPMDIGALWRKGKGKGGWLTLAQRQKKRTFLPFAFA